MKKVLLTSTAVALTAGWASAGDMSMSGAIKLTYGSFGTGTVAGAATDDFTSEADLDIAATSSGGAITMSGTLELDETGAATGPVSISSGALTFTYDNNDIGALALAAADGEDDNYGDYSVAFSAGGMGVVYTKDQDSSDNSVDLMSLPENIITGAHRTGFVVIFQFSCPTIFPSSALSDNKRKVSDTVGRHEKILRGVFPKNVTSSSDVRTIGDLANFAISLIAL